jgi:hypothetical protein
MPSDRSETAQALADQALDALAPRVQAFHSAVATAEEQVRSYVHRQRGQSEFKGEQALMELGPFAIGRIDPERFAQLLGEADELEPQAEDVLERAEAVLKSFAQDDQLHRIAVDPGGDLRDTVKDALTHVGQVFGVSRAVEFARAGTFDPDQHNQMLGSLNFRFWNRTERQLAPPLVVDVRGEDCLPAGLGEFLDGTVAIVLVASGPTTPAPLARLITPGTFVMQTTDPGELRALAQSHHPGVALLFDEERPEQARFVHDPDAGETPADRLTMHHMPDQPDVGRGRRAPTWLEELSHLAMLAASGPSSPSETVSAGAAQQDDDAPAVSSDVLAQADNTPADQLAAWLLAQTDLGDA